MIDKLRDYISIELQERSFEEILEDFDISAEEAFIILFNDGLIDEELFINKSYV
jgi:hypothetical protein